MATAFNIHLTPLNSGVFHKGETSSQSAAKASEVLQENHESHHIFFNKSGFHSRSSKYSEAVIHSHSRLIYKFSGNVDIRSLCLSCCITSSILLRHLLYSNVIAINGLKNSGACIAFFFFLQRF